MAERVVVVGSRVGLHARPAMLFTQAVAACGAEVMIGRVGGGGVDASSILFVMGLGVRGGEQVVLSSDDEGVLEELAVMLARDLDAE